MNGTQIKAIQLKIIRNLWIIGFLNCISFFPQGFCNKDFLAKIIHSSFKYVEETGFQVWIKIVGCGFLISFTIFLPFKKQFTGIIFFTR